MEAKLNSKDLYMLSESLSGITEAAIAHGSWSEKMGMKSSTEGYLHILSMAKEAMEVLYLWNATYDHAAREIKLAFDAMEDNK
jgi:hypothetical protein